MKHARMNGTRLVQPPPGTEDNVGTGAALSVPIAVAPGPRVSSLVVDERATLSRREDWFLRRWRTAP